MRDLSAEPAHRPVDPGTPPAAMRNGRLAHAALALGVVGWLASALALLVWGRGWNLDLRVYLAAGHALLQGSPVYALRFTERSLPFSYPPFALAALSPLSLLPQGLVEVLWWVLNAVALTATVWCGLDELELERVARLELAVGVGGVAALVLEPVRNGVDYGQINVVLMLLVVADLLVVRGRARGLLVGVASAVKLTPLYFVLYFVVARERRALATAVGSFAALTGLSWLLLPHESARYFLHELRKPDQFGGLNSVSNQAWSGILHRAPFAHVPVATLLWLVLSAATTVLAIWLATLVVQRSRLQATVVLALAGLLVSPLSWSHHWCWLVLLPITAWQLRAHRSLLVLQVAILACAALGPYEWFRHGASRSVASSLLCLLVAALLVWWLVVERRERRVTAIDRGPLVGGPAVTR